jgi:hypothetical protein
VSGEEKNGTALPAVVVDTNEAPEPGSPEHILGLIADRLNVLIDQNAIALNNDRIFGQALAMLLSGAAQKMLVKQEVEDMIRRLDPDAKFEAPSPILRPVPGRLS